MVGAGLMVKSKTLVAVSGVGVVLSATWTVKLNVPVTFGVPEIVPAGARERLVGRAPAVIDQV
jgi:hypothetical protein